MRDRLRVVLAGGIDHQLGDQRPAERGGQRILALVDGAGHERGKDEAIDEQVAGIERDRLDGPGFERLLLDPVEVVALAEIDSESDNVHVYFSLIHFTITLVSSPPE